MDGLRSGPMSHLGGAARMIVSAICPSCRHKYDVGARLAGRKVRCKNCTSIFRVPVPETTSWGGRAPGPGPCPEENLDQEDAGEAIELGESLPWSGSRTPQPERGRGLRKLTFLALFLLMLSGLNGFVEARWVASASCGLLGFLLLQRRIMNPAELSEDTAGRARTGSGFVAVGTLMAGILIAMEVIPLPLTARPPPQSEAEKERASRRAKQDILKRRFAGQAVTIQVNGLPSDPSVLAIAVERLEETIRGLATSAEVASAGEGTDWSFTLAPVSDPDPLMSKIDFGLASRKGTLIEVDLSPTFLASLTEAARTSEPLVEGSDDVEIALRDLKDKDRGIQKSAAARLSQLPVQEPRRRTVVSALVPLLDAGDDATALETVKALLAWRTEEAVSVLIDQLKDPRTEIRHTIMQGLARTGDARAIGAVLSRVKVEPQAVEEALKAVGVAAEPAIFPKLSDPDPLQREKACDLLAELGGEASVAALQPALSDREERVRVRAAVALKSIHERLAAQKKRK